MNREHGINFESVVEFILSIAIGVLFFLPWFGFAGDTISGAEIFPVMRDAMKDSPYSWAAYTLLLLYVIPLLAVISAICFIVLKPRAVRRNFISLCESTLILLIALVLVVALSASEGKDYWNVLLKTASGMGALYWAMLALPVAGLIFSAIAKSVSKPPLRAAEPGGPSA